MHIPDGMLEARTWLPAWLGSAGILGYAARRVRNALADGTVVMMAVMAALIFALQMLNFPVAGGTSGHFAGGAAAAIVLGLWPAMLVMAAVLTIQALLFADGGITALGANMLTMAVLAPLVGRAIWLLARRARENRTLQLVGAFAAGWCAAVAAALAAAVLLWLSGRVPLGPALAAMGVWHAIIGLGEGGITAGLVGYLLAVRPDLLDSADRSPAGASARRAAIVLGGVALVAAALSFAASAFPDGLEHVYSQLGSTVESRPLLRGPLAEYAMPGVSDDRLAIVLAAVVGAVVAGAAVYALARVSARADQRHGTAGVHGHEHRHEGQPAHEHPHHHQAAEQPPHEHTHATSFEALTYIVSPVHALDARVKIAAAVLVVLGVVLSPPLRAAETLLLVALLAAVVVLARLPLGRLLLRSAAVLPFAATIALLAPLGSNGGSWNAAGLTEAWAGGGLMVTWGILSKAWVSAACVTILAASTRQGELLAAMRRLGVPHVFVMLLSFIGRYVAVLGDQLRALRTALASRAPRLRGRTLVRSLGSIAGNLFVRSYERGERIHAAMLARGYTGVLPAPAPARLAAADVLFVAIAALTAAALALY